MKTKETFNILECIETIHQISKGSYLQEPLFEALEDQLALLCPYLQLNEIETILFANAFVNWFEDSNFQNVFEHFGMTSFQVLKYRESIDVLYGRNLLMNKESRKRRITSYELSQSIINIISNNEPLKIPKNEEIVKKNNLVDLLEEFDDMSDQFDLDAISFYDFKEYISALCKENEEMPLFREIKNYKLDSFETYFFLDVIWDVISAGDNCFNTGITRTVNDYFKKKSQALELTKKIINKETKLSTLNLIEISQAGFANKHNAKLSKKVTDFLHEHHDLQLDTISDKDSKLILSKNIPLKKLFLNKNEEGQLTQISHILKENQFKEMQVRLKERAMPLGISAIFHGVPGTGKTESVYQLAKESGRNIFKVDISETKSMWFGESQKLVKKIFTQYQEMKDAEELCPILLFNEADAVIGKRKSAGSSNIADTENAIQNIILEEMEMFDGILFATTNLVENIDAAFERRFLFKVQFEQPSLENSAKIWREKLSFLSEDESKKLAENFDFSGGEMENIARKAIMEELLHEKPNFKHIENWCKNEKWSVEKKGRIGF